MTLLAYIRTVLWGFIGIGIGSRPGHRDDLAEVTPLGLLGVAAVLLAVFGIALWGLARYAVSALQ